MIRVRSFIDPSSQDRGDPVERHVVELEDREDHGRFCDLLDLRRWGKYDVVFRATPSTEDYRITYGGLSYSARTERELMPASFDEAYALAEDWIINRNLPKHFTGHHIRAALSKEYDALAAYTDEWDGDWMSPAIPGAHARNREARRRG